MIEDNIKPGRITNSPKFTIKQDSFRQGCIAIAEFNSELRDWLLSNKKFRAVIEYDPKQRTKIEFQEIR